MTKPEGISLFLILNLFSSLVFVSLGLEHKRVTKLAKNCSDSASFVKGWKSLS